MIRFSLKGLAGRQYVLRARDCESVKLCLSEVNLGSDASLNVGLGHFITN